MNFIKKNTPYCKHYHNGVCNLGDACGFLHVDCEKGINCTDLNCKKGHKKNKKNIIINQSKNKPNKIEKDKKDKKEKKDPILLSIKSLSPILNNQKRNNFSPIDSGFDGFPKPSPRDMDLNSLQNLLLESDEQKLFCDNSNLLSISDLANCLNQKKKDEEEDSEIILNNQYKYYHQSSIYNSPSEEQINKTNKFTNYKNGELNAKFNYPNKNDFNFITGY